jgi:hypothetical protein
MDDPQAFRLSLRLSLHPRITDDRRQLAAAVATMRTSSALNRRDSIVLYHQDADQESAIDHRHAQE